MIHWPSPRFGVLPLPDDVPRRICNSWHSVLLDLVRSTPPREKVVVEASGPAMTAARAPIASGPRRKIVVIDDTEMLRIFIEEMLTAADPRIDIVTAVDGSDGLRRVASAKPDLVLLDYSLPDFNGDEVCRLLLEEEETAGIPVVMMSGHVPEMTAAAEQFPNIVATLAKPFLSLALVELVAATLENPPVVQARPAESLNAELAPPLPATAETPALPAAGPQIASNHSGNGHGPPPPALSPPEEPPEAVPPPAPPRAPTAILAAPPLRALALEHARIAQGRSNAVVIGIALEVVSMQFSATLRMAAIRGRRRSHGVALHMDPATRAHKVMPQAAFELQRVDLDSRGQINTVRVVPQPGQIAHVASRPQVSIDGLAVVGSNGARALELVPAFTAPMNVELLAVFDLIGVELSPAFTVASLVLQARQAPMRISFQPGAAHTGATFESTQVLLDRSSRIAEILLAAAA